MERDPSSSENPLLLFRFRGQDWNNDRGLAASSPQNPLLLFRFRGRDWNNDRGLATSSSETLCCYSNSGCKTRIKTDATSTGELESSIAHRPLGYSSNRS